MAVVPRSATRINIYSGVPFQSDYKHTRWFDSRSSQTAFFNSRVTVYEDNEFNIVKEEGKNSLKVPYFIDDIRNANYLSFNNGGKEYYAFITAMEYENPGTTTVKFVLDVIQSYMFDFEFQPSFVVREHQNPDTRNTLNEGLDYGDAYNTIHTAKFVPNQGLKFLVVLSKAPLHAGDDIIPSFVGVPQPLSFYVIPFWPSYSTAGGDMTSPQVRVDNPGGTGTTITGPMNAIQRLYKSEKAVNNIVSMYITEFPGLQFNIDNAEQPGYIDFKNDGVQSVELVEETGESVNMIYIEYVTRFAYMSERAVSNYMDHFAQTRDAKLKQSPYIKIIMDDMKGNRIELDPDKIYGSHIELNVKGGLGHANTIAYGIEHYNYLQGADLSHENEVINETAIINRNPQDVAILSDHLAAYMQGNRNSMQHQQNAWAFNSMFAGLNTGMSTAANMGSGNAMGTIGSLAGGVQGLGNTVLQIQGLEAQLKDIETTPPQVNSMGSSTHYDFGNQYYGVYFIFKEIKSEYRQKLDDFFHMFGWKQNETKIPNLRTNNHFNFIQTNACMIKGTFNNEDLTDIKNIFDNGITLWHTDDVGNYSLSNGWR